MAQPAPAARNDASRSSPGLTATNAAAGQKRKRTTERKFYAVREGKTPGIYETWPDCLGQVKGFKGAVFKAFQNLHEAQAWMDGKPLAENKSNSTDQKYYAVQCGQIPGVYTDWTQAQAQIRGFRKPKHKKFNTRAEAEAFVAAGKKSSGSEPAQNISPEEEIRRLIVKNSAPGLQINGTYAPTDKDGNPYELGRRPLPPGAEDGYDPNVKLGPDGTLVNRTEEEKRKTKMMVRERDAPGMLRIYTDGSSLRNGQAGARAGVGVFFGPQDPKNVSEALKGSKQTNQRAELTAILRALNIAPLHRDVTIYTDSKYSIDCVTNWYKNWQKNNWTNAKGKPVENKDLVVDIREKIEERDQFSKGTFFVWVKGHKDNVGNIAADRLAVEGAMMARGIDVEEVFGSENGSIAEEVARLVKGGDNEDDETKEAFEAMEKAMQEDGDGDEFK
ncbi:ribonuclease H-like domain-containing protein [Exophiala viscosa]|uniref:Ribonuclease H n=1 Tax=Exophiala viscosa TaxID=2486360 RepID=A0AAN6DY46_9EURO|nr:ribonuclease H-like domain-containing protein [Exophiala viscosa]KAI1624317.1 ribonuclease H-like domain-containing protein [Exophiala viscosa]